MVKYVAHPLPEPDTPVRTGVLLVNLGTPDEPTAPALRRYLRQFLGDPRVIEWPAWLWQPVLHGVILNVRPRKSARLYASVWTENGSPLLAGSQAIASQMAIELGQTWGDAVRVELAMRYGNPSIQDKLAALRQANVQRILVLPLFPQYSATTTATIFDVIFDELKRWRWTPELRTITGYHTHPFYISGLAHSIQHYWQANGRSPKLLFSFHGIPQSYAAQGDPYPVFCHETARLVADQLDLTQDEYQICFQSRFGPEAWLQPYTDKTLEAWAGDGLKSVDVACPGFAVDCLETLEEMAGQNRELFLEAGGQQYHYIPCLNDSPEQMALLLDLAKTHLQGWLMPEHAR